jgi:hypothetical protein
VVGAWAETLGFGKASTEANDTLMLTLMHNDYDHKWTETNVFNCCTCRAKAEILMLVVISLSKRRRCWVCIHMIHFFAMPPHPLLTWSSFRFVSPFSSSRSSKLDLLHLNPSHLSLPTPN